jgi:hypothetical protein
MVKLVGFFAVLALGLAIADLVHGPHNGDVHRYFIHIAEFIFFFGFLCLLEIWAFKTATRGHNLNRWLTATYLSLFTSVVSLILFGLSGGSFHGDGGPIASSFLLLWVMGSIVLPLSFVGFVVVLISRKRRGMPILDR